MGEVTITMEDAHHLLGFPTDGEVVSGRHGRHPFRQMVSDFLRVNPQAGRDLSGGLLGLHFLRERFQHYAGHAATEVDRMRYTRALILRILGGTLFVDTASSFVSARYVLYLDDFQLCGTFSWGSAVLAFLYKELCKVTDMGRSEMGDFALLLQLWVWTRFPSISPPLPEVSDEHAIYGARFNFYDVRQTVFTHILRCRHRMDVMHRRDFRWRPYLSFEVNAPPSDTARRWLSADRAEMVVQMASPEGRVSFTMDQFSGAQPGFHPEQYPPWSTVPPMGQYGFPSQSYPMYAGDSSSQPTQGLDSFTEYYRPTVPPQDPSHSHA
ncbi:protein MAIN-LIKE 2-like [Gastrolobium bilobum]|uniref:protein MAIN-LIKE 2-like n=1 Tax=Gastrolobium bilobum TaxID=150636 RepID=UPI002AB2B4A0|nr:protein MAIN-LIKE 2-like [Gastrolobium bilobum]